jgi:acyl-CoA thioesterase-1
MFTAMRSSVVVGFRGLAVIIAIALLLPADASGDTGTADTTSKAEKAVPGGGQKKAGAGKKAPSASALRRQAMVQIEDDPKLPRVLLVGDSIAMGYTLPLREMLKGQANVHYPIENCHTSRQILERLDTYLGDKPWDVINFNCGIHDLTLRDADGKSIKAGQTGKPWVPIDEYRENLHKVVARLQKTGATLVWCSSTPLPDIWPHRRPADIERYNAVAKEVMQQYKIPITDLHAAVQHLDEPKYDDGAHLSIDACKEIAREVGRPIVKALDGRGVKKQ